MFKMSFSFGFLIVKRSGTPADWKPSGNPSSNFQKKKFQKKCSFSLCKNLTKIQDPTEIHTIGKSSQEF
jgi:hypothetical protein